MKNTNELFENNLGIAYDIAYKEIQKWDKHIELDDMKQMCLFGLYKASLSYKHRAKVKFITYATKVIKNEIYKELGKIRKNPPTCSIDNNISNTSLTYHDIFQNQNQVSEIENLENKLDLEKIIIKYNERDKKIFKLLCQGYSGKEIQNKLNLTKETVFWTRKKIKEDLYEMRGDKIE